MTQWLEVRRHAQRRKPGPNLCQEGVTLARSASTARRRFARVVTSTADCAVQTAIAMGFAVDEEDPWLSSLGQVVSAEIEWDAGFRGFYESIHSSEATGLYARMQAMLWRQILTEVDDGQDVLVVTHGGIAEAGVIASAEWADLRGWGGELGYCEGVRLRYEDEACTEVHLHRFDGWGHEIEPRGGDVQARAVGASR
jgi:hypothetical protein